MISNGPSSLTPRVASTSEAPDIEETRRLPCLATLTPAPAAIRAAQVETLKVPWLSPPVPTISTASSGTATRIMRARSICAAPVISSTVSPRTRSAIRKAPIWAGVAAPAVIWSRAVRISSSLSVAPCETFWISWRNSWEGWPSMVASCRMAGGVNVATPGRKTGEIEEVGEQRVSVLGGDALGVELHPIDGMYLVLQPHDQPVGFRRHLEVGGQISALNDQGVVAGHLEAARQGTKHALAGVMDLRELAVHRLGRAHDPAAVGLANGLMAEAHAQHGDVGTRRFDQLQADAGLVRRTGPRREHDALGREANHLGDRNLVVTEDLASGAKLAQEVNEVIGKTVIVIDEDQHGRGFRGATWCRSSQGSAPAGAHGWPRGGNGAGPPAKALRFRRDAAATRTDRADPPWA